mmetsp:Transcript_1781/g.2617  ORF Transcript_1781/g.2617 Transcript_1781/m.2617 type:complete len:86 (-) Transcript_1781:228-485(-)
MSDSDSKSWRTRERSKLKRSGRRNLKRRKTGKIRQLCQRITLRETELDHRQTTLALSILCSHGPHQVVGTNQAEEQLEEAEDKET